MSVLTEPLDPRLNAYRPDLADLALKGQVTAARFVPAEAFQVSAPQAPLRRQSSERAPLETEALFGEAVSVFDRTDGWAWVQLKDDGYVGWMPLAALEKPHSEPTHRVAALRTLVFSEPDIKSPLIAGLPLGARVTVVGEASDRNARYALTAPRGAVVVQHLAPLGAVESDWAEVAERFLGVPYLWGGKTSLGIDCSGLVQVACRACGIAAPRDTDMQEASLGRALPLDGGMPPLERGDFLFWRGHVGIMRDAATLIHANVYHMAVRVEPLEAAVARIARGNLSISNVRRIEG